MHQLQYKLIANDLVEETEHEYIEWVVGKKVTVKDRVRNLLRSFKTPELAAFFSKFFYNGPVRLFRVLSEDEREYYSCVSTRFTTQTLLEEVELPRISNIKTAQIKVDLLKAHLRLFGIKNFDFLDTLPAEHKLLTEVLFNVLPSCEERLLQSQLLAFYLRKLSDTSNSWVYILLTTPKHKPTIDYLCQRLAQS